VTLPLDEELSSSSFVACFVIPLDALMLVRNSIIVLLSLRELVVNLCAGPDDCRALAVIVVLTCLPHPRPRLWTPDSRCVSAATD
jgi:hypothetical protein